MIILLKLISLFYTGISSNRTDVDHAVSEFHEGTSLLWKCQLRHISKDEVDELLVLLFTKPLNEAVASYWLAESEGSQTVLSKTEIKQGCDICSRGGQLFLLFDEIGAPNL